MRTYGPGGSVYKVRLKADPDSHPSLINGSMQLTMTGKGEPEQFKPGQAFLLIPAEEAQPIAAPIPAPRPEPSLLVRIGRTRRITEEMLVQGIDDPYQIAAAANVGVEAVRRILRQIEDSGG